MNDWKYIQRFLNAILITTLVFVMGCELEKIASKDACDNQNNLFEESFMLVNPIPPEDLDYKQINDQHEVLVAVLGTGVDYNHPFLKRRMHYMLTENNELVRLGWDFTGNDQLPSPYIAKEIRINEVDYTRLPLVTAIDDMLQQYLKYQPSLAGIVNPLRNHYQEHTSKAGESTAVAGLIAQYDKRIGILPYRYAPVSHVKDGMNHIEIKINSLLSSIEKAVEDGAKIVNISEHFYQTKKSVEASNNESALTLPSLDDWKSYREKFKKIVQKNKDMLFIVSTGDNYNFIKNDNDDIINFPCGVEANNILCVGAINKKGKVLKITNIPDEKLKTIYVIGEWLRTAFPENMCGLDSIEGVLISNADTLSTGSDSIEGVSRTMAILCSSDKRFFKGRATRSGSGFAAALVTNLAAKIAIENVDFTPKNIIGKIEALSLVQSQEVKRIVYSKEMEQAEEIKQKVMFETDKIKNKKIGVDKVFNIKINTLNFDYRNYKEHNFYNPAEKSVE